MKSCKSSPLLLLFSALISSSLPSRSISFKSGFLFNVAVLFLIASFSDFLDGYLARKTNSESVLGEILDPIADKLLIVFVLNGLSINLDSFLIGFISAVIISREIWVAALRDINARNNQSDKTKVTFLAKTKTAIQMLSILMYLLGLTINNMMVLFFADIILIIALLVTIQTGFQYTISTFKK